MAEIFRPENQRPTTTSLSINRDVIMNIMTLAIQLLIVNSMPVGGNIIIRPQNTIVSVGSETRLECGTDLIHPMMWFFTPSNSSQRRRISLGKQIVSKFAEKYQVNTSIGGRFDLIILSVCIDDVGTYSCFDNEGEDDISASADLTVTFIGGQKKCKGESLEVQLFICGSHPGDDITVDYFNNSVFDPRNPVDESSIRHFQNNSDESEFCRYIQVRVTVKHGIVNCSDRIFEERRSDNQVGQIVGVSVSSVIIFIILVIAAVYIKKVLRRKKKSAPGQPTYENATSATDDRDGNEENTSETQLYPTV